MCIRTYVFVCMYSTYVLMYLHMYVHVIVVPHSVPYQDNVRIHIFNIYTYVRMYMYMYCIRSM